MPITLHQWQTFHLEQTMGGMTQLEAFAAVGLDAAIIPRDVLTGRVSPDWAVQRQTVSANESETKVRVTIQTPSGTLSKLEVQTPATTYLAEHLIKNQAEAEIFLAHWPGQQLDAALLAEWYGRVGDAGILRGFTEMAHQPGPWQDFCELVGTQEAILWAMDDPSFVHQFLQSLTEKRVRFVHEQMPGAKFDLVEHGGGAASSSVISPAMFDEFCVPYDRQIIDALHELGFPVVYHTCGGMKAILDRIAANGCDASETLSPPGVGGDIASDEDRRMVKQTLGSKASLIGGIDQGLLEKPGQGPAIARNVRECFETFGAGGGYICSASDHFFHAPIENLKTLAAAAVDCVY
jgi:uroporphyrinogen-III decarboxylase